MRRGRPLLLLLLTALTLTALDARGGGFDGVRRVADTALGPAQAAVSAALGREPAPDTAALEAEVARLNGELRRSEGLQRRVTELDALLGLTRAGSYPTVPAQVTGAGSAFGFGATVAIDAGSRDGVREGQTVLAGDGLVGRTVRVGPYTSTVLLLTDPGFTAGARLTREGTVGLATGDGRRLTYELVEGGRVSVGDGLLTTGSDTFVPGVPVGRVTAVRADPGALVTTAVVEPYVDLASLDLVGVVTEPPRGTPRVPLPLPR